MDSHYLSLLVQGFLLGAFFGLLRSAWVRVTRVTSSGLRRAIDL